MVFSRCRGWKITDETWQISCHPVWTVWSDNELLDFKVQTSISERVWACQTPRADIENRARSSLDTAFYHGNMRRVYTSYVTCIYSEVFFCKFCSFTKRDYFVTDESLSTSVDSCSTAWEINLTRLHTELGFTRQKFEKSFQWSIERSSRARRYSWMHETYPVTLICVIVRGVLAACSWESPRASGNEIMREKRKTFIALVTGKELRRDGLGSKLSVCFWRSRT